MDYIEAQDESRRPNAVDHSPGGRGVKLPEDIRLISLRYAGRCASRGSSLAAGRRAHWSPSSKKVWCIGCAGDSKSSVMIESGVSLNPKTKTRPTRSNSSQPADDGPQAVWRQLCVYLQRCLEAEAAESLVPYVGGCPGHGGSADTAHGAYAGNSAAWKQIHCSNSRPGPAWISVWRRWVSNWTASDPSGIDWKPRSAIQPPARRTPSEGGPTQALKRSERIWRRGSTAAAALSRHSTPFRPTATVSRRQSQIPFVI